MPRLDAEEDDEEEAEGRDAKKAKEAKAKALLDSRPASVDRELPGLNLRKGSWKIVKSTPSRILRLPISTDPSLGAEMADLEVLALLVSKRCSSERSTTLPIPVAPTRIVPFCKLSGPSPAASCNPNISTPLTSILPPPCAETYSAAPSPARPVSVVTL